MSELELEWDLKSLLHGSEMKKKWISIISACPPAADNWYFP